MKKILRSLMLAAAAFAVLSCDGGLADLEGRKAAMDEKITSLQEAVAAVNEEVTLLQAVADGAVVSSVTETGSSWEIALSSGTVLTFAKGSVPPAVAPVLTIDADGWWKVDYGHGATFLLYPDGTKVGATGVDFTAPLFGVDGSGYWTVSFDGGATSARVLDVGGQPVSALPAAATDGFFSQVGVEGDYLVITRISGEELRLPIEAGLSLSVAGSDAVQSFYYSQQRSFKIVSSGVASVVVFAPEGWQAAVDGEDLVVRAPASATRAVLADTRSDITLMGVSSRGLSVMATLKVSLSGPAPTKDDRLESWNDGDVLTIAGIDYSKSADGAAGVLKATAVDQVLETSLSGGTKVWFLEAEDGCNFALNGGALPADVVIVSRYKSQPVTVRFKATTPLDEKSFVAKAIVFDARSVSVIGFTLSTSATALAARYHFDGCRFNWKYNKNLISLNNSSSNGGIRSLRIVNSDIDMRVDASATRMTFILTQNCKTVGSMEELVFEDNIVIYDSAKPFNITATGSSSSSSAGGPAVSVRYNTFYNATPAQTLLFIDTFSSCNISYNIWSVPDGGNCGGYLVRTTVPGIDIPAPEISNIAYGTTGTLYDFHTSSTYGTRTAIPYIPVDPVLSVNQDLMTVSVKAGYTSYGARR